MGMVSAASAGTRWFYGYFLANMTNGATAPLIPLFLVVAFSGTILQVGLVTAATSIASIPAFIIWGNLSDHMHRRKLFIVEGFAGLSVAIGLMCLSIDFSMFFLANFLLGLLYTASAPAGTALLIEQTPREHWVNLLGKFSKLGGGGYLIGLVAGAVWFYLLPSSSIEMRLFFVFAALLALSGAILAVVLVREEKGLRREDEVRNAAHWNAIAGVPLRGVERAKFLPARIGAFVRLAAPSAEERREISPRLWAYFLVTTVFSAGFTSFYAVFPNYLAYYLGGRFNFSESLIFIVYIGSTLTSTLTYGIVSSLARKHGERRLQSAAASARVIIMPMFFAAAVMLRSPWEIVLATIFLNSMMGLCWAVISVTGQSMVAGMAGPHIRGEAMGLYNSSMGAGAILGAVMGGVVTQSAGYFGDFLFSSCFVASGVLLLAVMRTGSPATEQEKASASLMKLLRSIVK